MLESLYKLQDRRWLEKEERSLDWDGSYGHPVSDTRESTWGPR